jgi:hypothetical protein
MALVLTDRTQQIGTANTTVSFTLTGTVAGFQSFAGIGNTNTTYYAATDGAGNWESGVGTYSTTGPTLTRTTILASSNAGSAVTFSGVVNVFVTYPSAKSLYTDLIGVSVQAYDATIVKTGVANTFTAQQTFKGLVDTVFTITDAAAFEIDPANGSMQVITLGASRTPAATNFSAGECVLLGIDDGTAYSITWTTVAVTWVKAGGTASAPTLATTGYTWVLLWKVGSVIYGATVGSP